MKSKYESECRDDAATNHGSSYKEDPSAKGWTSLLEACKTGTLDDVRKLLENGVDPNYQHPNIPTQPIYAAIRHGHWHILQVLLEKGASMHNSTELATGMTPLQVAIFERQHVIVDYLIERLTPEECVGLRTFLVSGRIGKSLMIHLAGSGHVLYVDDEYTPPELIMEVQRITGNRKVYLTDMLVQDLKLVTHWLVRERDELLRYLREYTTVMKRLKRIVVMIPKAKPSLEVSWLLQNCNRAAAIVEPASMWNRLADSKWPEHWINSVWWILATHDSVEGELYTYLRRPVPLKPDNHPRIWKTAYKPLTLAEV